MRRFSNSRRSRKGASVVEFAFVAPIFFFLVFGIIEFGRIVMVQQIITSASREGARHAILDGASIDSVKSAVNDYLNAASFSGATTEVSPDPESVLFGQPVSVTVSIPYGEVSWVPSSFFFSEDQALTSRSTMRREGI